MNFANLFAASDRPKARAECHIRDLAGERIVYEPKTHEVAVLNSTASFIFGLCDGTHTVGDILAQLERRYEAPRARLELDLYATLADLRRRELLD